MFAVDMPHVDSTLLAETMNQWKEFWMLPAMMAAGIAVLFFIGFWDRTKTSPVSEGDAVTAAGKEELP